MKKKTNKVDKVSRNLGYVRERMISDGAYDGRFRSRTEIDRKKEASRKACRDRNFVE